MLNRLVGQKHVAPEPAIPAQRQRETDDKKEKTPTAEEWVHKDNAVVVYKYVGVKDRGVAHQSWEITLQPKQNNSEMVMMPLLLDSSTSM